MTGIMKKNGTITITTMIGNIKETGTMGRIIIQIGMISGIRPVKRINHIGTISGIIPTHTADITERIVIMSHTG